ncbi:MAG: tRNA (adenosine(37)-N6)-threonylcarbamoyltransferase complex transferase subunit TsaD [Chlamydiota bacterium]|nr:tRNA (adenosine(37)-N6)-threonylcarbamoyltransferase complex transferase subunit TsaD [Chlamydiota bacterium]
MLVLGIESTCDETACSVVRNGKEILSNVVASQVKLHEEFGGVVPELACRQHVEVIIPVLDRAIQEANISLDQVDLIAVSHAPGLIGALLIGLNAAKSLSIALNKPFIGVNHIEAHLYAAIMSQNQEVTFPSLGVVLSGGHTSLVLMKSIGDYELIAETIDDAIGEAFDKVAKMMGLPYPGGPEIEKLALMGDARSYPLKAGRVKTSPLNFSFSGLKTAVLYSLCGQNAPLKSGLTVTDKEKRDMAATFQRVAFEDVVKKTMKAAKENGCKTIIFGGGVTNNKTLRAMFSKTAVGFDLLWPSAGLSLDNAAMIAGLGYHQYSSKEIGDNLDLEAKSRVPFGHDR